MQAKPCFVPLKKRQSPRFRIFCFPYAGGSAVNYFHWGALLPGDVDLVAIQYAGRGGRFKEKAKTDLGEIVREIGLALTPDYTDVPFALFGHSMGAMVAYELAVMMREATGGGMPQHLFVSGRRPPHHQTEGGKAHLLSDAELVDYLHQLGGTPSGALNNAQLFELVIPPLRADLQAIETWRSRPRAPLQIPITVFGGVSDALAPFHALDGWSAYSEHGARKHVFPGGHFFLQQHGEAMVSTMLARTNVTPDAVAGRTAQPIWR
jgi:medium-chain acyl-[acyl-carrier-protein] hydrolase